MSVIMKMLIAYLLSLVITVPVYTFVWWKADRSKGKRQALISSIHGFFISLIPALSLIMLIATVVIETSFVLKDGVKKWISGDPTAPHNLNDPDFKPPEKRKKKIKPSKPIKNRFEVLDL
jgi:hypothetical protein